MNNITSQDSAFNSITNATKWLMVKLRLRLRWPTGRMGKHEGTTVTPMAPTRACVHKMCRVPSLVAMKTSDQSGTSCSVQLDQTLSQRSLCSLHRHSCRRRYSLPSPSRHQPTLAPDSRNMLQCTNFSGSLSFTCVGCLPFRTH